MDYKIYQSKLIEENHSSFVKNCSLLYNIIQHKLNTGDSTWNYYKYNVFVSTSRSILFYKLFKELNFYIRDFFQNDELAWMDCWLNYHVDDNQLRTKLGDKCGFHGHNVYCHGYISIDPQDTTTKFKNGLEIKNKIGQIYIGPGHLYNDNIDIGLGFDHYVELNSPSSKPRITIAFDIHTSQNFVHGGVSIPIL